MVARDVSRGLQLALCAIMASRGKLTACLMVKLRFRLGRVTVLHCALENGSDLHVNVGQKIRHYRAKSILKNKDSSTLNPDTIRFRTIRIQSRLNPLPIASTLAQYVARYVAQITSDAHYLE